ncbi:hypothetical protein V7S43_004204 [Phytophthora oleae]|uniref:AGC-kinase C-terminal domain-containing protein n=1 Tax=Phytophthora oleae TaxID=2107226 RepID=A0ABD3FZ35_9STRA
MNSPTPTYSSAPADTQASPTAVATGTTAVVSTNTAVSSDVTEKICVTKYFALHKEKQHAKPSSAGVDPKELFGDDYPLAFEDDPEEEDGEQLPFLSLPLKNTRGSLSHFSTNSPLSSSMMQLLHRKKCMQRLITFTPV